MCPYLPVRQQIKLTIKLFQKRNDLNNFPGSGADTTCFYASPSFCNLLPFFFLKAVYNRNSWHYITQILYRFFSIISLDKTSRYCDAIYLELYLANVPITSGSATNKVDNKTIPKTEMTWKIVRVQELTQHALMHPLPFATFCHAFS
jgi:hypothetical protein